MAIFLHKILGRALRLRRSCAGERGRAAAPHVTGRRQFWEERRDALCWELAWLMFLLRSSVADALPLSAGVTLYVAASDLIPEVNREPGAGMAVLVFFGVAVMLLLKTLFHG